MKKVNVKSWTDVKNMNRVYEITIPDHFLISATKTKMWIVGKLLKWITK